MGNQTQTIGQEWFSNSFPYIFGFQCHFMWKPSDEGKTRGHTVIFVYRLQQDSVTKLVNQQVSHHLTSIIDGIPLKKKTSTTKKNATFSTPRASIHFAGLGYLVPFFVVPLFFPSPTTRMFSAMFVTNSTSVLYT